MWTAFKGNILKRFLKNYYILHTHAVNEYNCKNRKLELTKLQYINIIITHADWLTEWGTLKVQACFMRERKRDKEREIEKEGEKEREIKREREM